MRRVLFLSTLSGLALLLLAACGEQRAAVPPPARLDGEAQGYFCGMSVAEHPGPKAQIHLADREAPLWFGQVSDAVAYVLLPEKSAEIAAVYVHDMGRAESWAAPGEAAWIAAEAALYVIDSERPGGMGAPEAMPFSQRADAEAFVAQYRGRIVGFGEIPQDYVLGGASAFDPGRAQQAHRAAGGGE